MASVRATQAQLESSARKPEGGFIMSRDTLVSGAHKTEQERRGAPRRCALRRCAQSGCAAYRSDMRLPPPLF